MWGHFSVVTMTGGTSGIQYSGVSDAKHLVKSEGIWTITVMWKEVCGVGSEFDTLREV